MTRLFLLFTILLCTCAPSPLSSLLAQSLSGKITDAQTGEPLPFASIYVQEAQSGSASNADGIFDVRLAPGRNTVVFQYLGYETQVITSTGGQVDVEMVSAALDLEEVEVLSGGEDKSYSVIRRAIAKADYHLNQVDRYRADVYVRGTGKVNKIGGAIRLLVGKEGREDIDEAIDRPFTTESTSIVNYERPNTYRQEVTQKYTVGEENFDASNYIFTTFYQPLIGETVVSPLNPKAFAYYKFRLEGVFVDQDRLINKISVIPRSPGEDVFEGAIYIVQDDWSIHSLELATYKFGIKIDIQQRYAEVLDRTWLPINTKLDAAGSILGVGFEYHYIGTIANYEVELNPDLTGYVEVIDEKSNPDVAAAAPKRRTVDELEQALDNGEEVTRKDLRRLMRSYEKQERQKQEEPEVVSNTSFTDTSAVTVKDSAAWAQIRPIPLTEEEKRGYVIADSVAQSTQVEEVRSSNDDDETDRAAGAEVDTTAATGGKRNFRRQWLAPVPVFNPVAGYTLGGTVAFGNQKKQYGFSLTPSYGFNAKRGFLEGAVFLGRFRQPRNSDFANPLKRPRWRLSGGRALRQFNDSPSIDPWLSAYFNLLSGRNFIRLYERAYGRLGYERDYGDALTVRASATYEDRRAMRNSTNSNWLGLDDEEQYALNAPVNNVRGLVEEVEDAAVVDIELAYRPGLRYRIRNGNRELIAGSAPTIGLRLRQGIPEIGNSTADFTQVQASYEHRFDVGRKGKAKLLARAGAFLNAGNVDFPDFRHFEGSEVTLVAADPLASYRLLPYYLESTNEEYLEIFAHYQFRKFLLTQIRPVHLFGLKEDLFVNYLYTPTSDNYTEVGYSLDNILRIFRLEFVTAFRDFEYHDFGVRFGVATSIGDLIEQF